MIESFFAHERVRTRLRQKPFGPYIESLAARLVEEGYTRTQGQVELRSAAAFGRWLVERGLALQDARDYAASYIGRIGRYRNGKKPQAATSVGHFLQHLQENGVLRAAATPAPDTAEAWLAKFDDHLVRVAGTVRGTRSLYIRVAKRLLKARYGDAPPTWSSLTAQDIADFVLREAFRNEGPPRRAAVTATRAFLRFLIFSGHIAPGLLAAAPPVREWKLASLPRFISSGDVARVLASVDDKSVLGLRDKAILLILARLGLRAGEVAQLDLEDIDWPQARIVVRGSKTLRGRCLPLPHDIGTAIVQYLKEARPKAGGRSVFLRHIAPRRRLTTQAVTALAGRYLRRAGVKASRMGAHALRHTVATELVRHGATFKEVADVLGHQCLQTTQVYAKLDMTALSGVGLPWPGGVQ